MSKKNLLRIFGLAVGTALCLCACSPEEYGPCSIPDTSAHRAACKPQGDSKTATCTADYVFDCDSMICGKFENSAAFCTHRCNPSADECNSSNPDNCKWGEGVKVVDKCPEDAACVEWTPGTGAYYCLPQEKGCSSNYYNYSSSDPFCKDFAGKTKPTKPSTPTDTKPYDNGHSCSSASDCKSGNCDSTNHCADIVSTKKDDGEACTADTECKNGKCQKDNPSGSGKVCGEATTTLKEDGEACTADTECKNGKCQKDNPDTSVGGKVCGEAEVVAACGNAVLDDGEGCDDGNTADGDGCSADCTTVESGYECPTPGSKCLLALTSVCTDHSECASGRCVAADGETDKKCAERLGKDSPCVDEHDCLETLRCVDNTAGEGKICADPEPEKFDIGTSCSSNDQCGSNCCAGEDGAKVCADESACTV